MAMEALVGESTLTKVSMADERTPAELALTTTSTQSRTQLAMLSSLRLR